MGLELLGDGNIGRAFTGGDLNVSKAAGYTLTVADVGKRFNNTGAAGAIVLQLPPAKKGMIYKGYVSVAQYLKFLCDGAEVINKGPDLSGAYVRSNTLHSGITLVAPADGLWEILEEESLPWSIGT